MVCFRKQVAIYGKPTLVVSDRGSQLVSANRELREWENWGDLVKDQGIEWRFTPTACPWRNGQAERVIALAKHTLKHTLDSFTLLNFTELETCLMKVASILNKRPLAAKDFRDDNFHPVSPADLLLGRIHGYRPSAPTEFTGDPDVVDMGVRADKLERVVELWWARWTNAAFPLFCPRRKWCQPHRNLQKNDIVMLKPDTKLGPGVFRLGRVLEVVKDDEGMVRTVRLGLRRKRGAAREKAMRCQQGLEESTMAVQRLILIQPATEKWSSDLPDRQQ